MPETTKLDNDTSHNDASDPSFKRKTRDDKPIETLNIHYAGFGWRMAASLLDTFIMALLIVPVTYLIHHTFNFTYYGHVIDLSYLKREESIIMLEEAFTVMMIQTAVLSVIVLAFWKIKDATPGKMLLGMKIANAKDFSSPTFSQNFVRYFIGYPLALLPATLGFVWIYYDKRHQGLHDKLAKTVVIMEPRGQWLKGIKQHISTLVTKKKS